MIENKYWYMGQKKTKQTVLAWFAPFLQPLVAQLPE